VSLYLSCEPTTAEKERALAEAGAAGASTTAGATGDDGRATAASGAKEKDRVPWRRPGKYKFTFEVCRPFLSFPSFFLPLTLYRRRFVLLTVALPSRRWRRTIIRSPGKSATGAMPR
jgi:hypothetical protein